MPVAGKPKKGHGEEQCPGCGCHLSVVCCPNDKKVVFISRNLQQTKLHRSKAQLTARHGIPKAEDPALAGVSAGRGATGGRGLAGPEPPALPHPLETRFAAGCPAGGLRHLPVGDFPELETSDTDGRFSTSDTQEDILEELLNDMALGPVPDEGASSLAVAPEHPPQLLLSPNLDMPAPYPNPTPPENPLKQLLMPQDDWEFEVTAFYRGRQVFQQTVFCPRGLRLVGSDGGDRTLPGQPITLPDPGAFLTDRAARDYVSRVLSGLGGGLALRREGQRLCAQRLGSCHTYWAVGEELLPDSGRGPDGEVPKETGGSVFNLGPFVADLIAFINGSGRSPRYTFWFCIAEPWPQHQPWTKKLVMVKVVPTCLRALLEMARVGGASSLENTVDLHISNSQPLSLTSEQYKAYLQDLVEDMDF
ncbi:PREDICTED: interferon regulatory factor 3 isoform X3 [Myotis davidii]|uniref:interferon regulatory factor 3 isoform X3 n=1 Tax=Myotis davidii TaxID=225400 RepID=UPI0007679CDE|nr:PREDICTED: interferon regulatory factor 3 isoform X3 [Myotis davidii]